MKILKKWASISNYILKEDEDHFLLALNYFIIYSRRSLSIVVECLAKELLNSPPKSCEK
jgi:hypothetical protein